MIEQQNIHLRVAEVLRDLGRKECIETAALLAHSDKHNRRLHLRSLSLSSDEAALVAIALKGNEATGDTNIESISFSHNRGLGNDGAIALINALPISIRELGFVNCGIRVLGGQELLRWMESATNLKMMCAEQNSFSDKLKSEYHKFSIANPQIMVVV